VIRAVLAVALALALVGVTSAGVEEARLARTDGVVEGELRALDRAAASLYEREETTPGPGPRRTVTLTLPAADWDRAGVDELLVGEAGPTPTVSYRLGGGPERRHRLSVPLSVPGEPVRIREPGRHRLVLTLVRRHDRRVVRVRRADV
jgi:hypothetical protein